MADQNHDTKAHSAAAPAKAHEAPKAHAPAAQASQAAPAAAKAAEKASDAPKAAAASAPAAAKAAAKPARRTKTSAPRAKAAAKPARKSVNATAKAASAAAAKTSKAAQAAARTNSKTMNEGTRTMKNEATKTADRVQAVFGDVNERAKTALERNSRVAEEMTELSKGNIEAMVASTKIAAKGVETLGQEVAEFSRKSFEDASAAIRSFAEVKSPTDFFRLQGEFARTQLDSMISESSRLSEKMIKLAGDMAQPMTNRYSVAAERVKSVVAR
jgi:phasin family protein